MRYATHIQRFLYSQYFYGGLRIAAGLSLPPVVMLLVFHNPGLGFTLSTGALAACAVDMPGPLKHKHNDMLMCSLISFVSALITGLATGWSAPMWLTVVPLTFLFSMLVAYGFRWPQISFGALFVMAVTLNKHFTPEEALLNACWVLVGGLWYTYWSTLVSRWQNARLEQQAIAESVLATAQYLRARARFYRLDTDLEDCYAQLITKQVAAVNLQDAARDIVLRNLPELRSQKLDVRRTLLFNLFIHIVDLHNMIVAAHAEYALMRATFGASDILVFFHDFLVKSAQDLEEVGLAALQNRPLERRSRVKAELRALDYEIDVLRRKQFPVQHPEAYAALVAACERCKSVSRLIKKMRAHTQPGEQSALAGAPAELIINQALQRFLKYRDVSIGQLFSNFKLASPTFRHALRMSTAVALGLWLGKFLPLTNSYWICLTSIVILKPGFSLTKQYNAQRLVGTFIGCAASLVLVFFVKSPIILMTLMFTCLVLSYSFSLFHYPTSVVFTSSYVLILYNVLAPESFRLIGERALDTAIGCAIAITISHLFPYWEYRVMGPLIREVIGSMRHYFKAITTLHTKLDPTLTEGSDYAAQRAQATLFAERDVDCRLARKNMHIAFANLGTAFSRMMLEPKAQQKCAVELNDLLIQSHVLAGQLTAVAPLITLAQTTQPQALHNALTTIDDHLARAERHVEMPASATSTDSLAETALSTTLPPPIPGNAALTLPHNPLTSNTTPTEAQAQHTLNMLRELDHLALQAEYDQVTENSAESSTDLAHEIKLLAHQCKQMISASESIQKDAQVLRALSN